MRKRNAAIVLTVLAILAAVIVREWQDDSVEPVSVVSGEAVPRELSAVHPKVPGARPDGVLESAIVQTPPGPLVDRSKMNAPPTAAVQSTKPLAIAPQPLVSDREHDDRRERRNLQVTRSRSRKILQSNSCIAGAATANTANELECGLSR